MIIKKILAFLFRKELVVLVDFEGQEYVVFRRKSHIPGKPDWAYVYDYVCVGHVTLLQDGTTGGNSSYIHTWHKV